ncbi:hypothetical protein GC169_04600 [bacterium]|nr:hypothetical protein [bacterium]
MIDTDATYTFKQAPLRMLLFALASGGMAAVAASLVVIGETSVMTLVGWAGSVFFGGGALLILWRAFATSGPVVCVSPEGVLDVRVSRRPAPFSAITFVGEVEISGQRMVYVGVSREVFDTLEPTRIAKMSWGANRSIVGVDGIPVVSQGLNVRHADLLELITAFAARYGS